MLFGHLLYPSVLYSTNTHWMLTNINIYFRCQCGKCCDGYGSWMQVLWNTNVVDIKTNWSRHPGSRISMHNWSSLFWICMFKYMDTESCIHDIQALRCQYKWNKKWVSSTFYYITKWVWIMFAYKNYHLAQVTASVLRQSV